MILSQLNFYGDFKIKLKSMRSSDIIKQAKFDNYLYKSKIIVELETLHADIKFKS